MEQEAKIRVAVRKRPLSQKEIKRSDPDIIECQGRGVVVKELKQKVDLTKYIEEHEFIFDDTFDEQTTNEQIYETAV